MPAAGKLLFSWFFLESFTQGRPAKEEGTGKGKTAFPPTLVFFSLFDICHYFVTLFGASKVVSTKFGGSPALLLWKSQRVGSAWGFL